MFDGVPVEHFPRFISTPSSNSPPPAVSASTNLNYLSFDPLLFPPLHTHQPLFQSNHCVLTPTHDDQYNHTEGNVVDQEIDLGPDTSESWSNDEVIQLLRIKSSSENWFKDLTNWDHVSRKLAEMGYKRSSEKCKEKFEEETCRSFSSTIGCDKSSSSRYLINEEHLCNNSEHHVIIESPNHQLEQPQLQLEIKGGEQNLEKDPMAQPTQKSKKRKRKQRKFKMVKGLCVDLVNKLLAQQEQMHNKLLENMAKRDEEKMKREEAWRREDMERVQREINIREHEQETARDTINQFLNKITSFDKKIQIPFNMNLQDLQAANASTNIDKPMPLIPSPEIVKDDNTGKRWPRDEVLALINIRSNVSNNGIGGYNAEEYIGNCNKLDECGGGGRCSLWERISQGMSELGYNRSAKRCKEKWENINKYFRKTKDANKKRSLESRTCPYYHELSKLYNKASLSNSTGLSSQELPEN